MLRKVTSVLAAAVFLLAGPAATPALADIAFQQSSPSAGSTVTEPIDEVRLSFTRPVHQSYSSVVVIGPDGTDHADGRVEVLLDVNLAQKVRDLSPGTYRVTYAAGLTTADVARGEFAFTVAESATDAVAQDEGEPSAAPTQDNVGVLLVCAVLVAFVVLLVVMFVRRGLKKESELPPYRPGKGESF